MNNKMFNDFYEFPIPLFTLWQDFLLSVAYSGTFTTEDSIAAHNGQLVPQICY